jgi:hypothetical protein
MLAVNLRALSQKLCSHYARGQYPGIESKVMLTLCSRSISGHYAKSYAHFMLTGQSPGIPGIIIEGEWAVLP